ncbi:MAG: creatininase family protein [Prochlorotrichaceae cyanobacterium]
MQTFIPSHRFLPYLTWQEVESLTDKEKVVILQPVGAIEQHGPHLPLIVDAAIVTGVIGHALNALAPEIPAYALPTLCYGKSNEHWHFPGTITLTAITLLQTLMEVGESLYRAGFRKIVFINGHGGQPQVVEIAARDLRQRFADLQVFPHFIWNALPAEAFTPWLNPQEAQAGIHAGDAETSLMLALLPDTVKIERAVAEYPPALTPYPHLSWEGACPITWMTRDLSQTGTIGDPTTASAEKGEQMLNALSAAWQQIITEIYAFEFPDSRGGKGAETPEQKRLG